MKAELIMSMVKNATGVVTEDVEVGKLFNAIREGKWRKEIEEIRRRYSSTAGDIVWKKEAVAPLKRELPGAMFSGRFISRKTPADEKLIEHSGLIIADLDSLGADLLTVRRNLRSSRHLYGMFLSPSGDGLKLCFAVPADASRHSDSFRAVAAHIFKLTGIRIDQSGKDVSRLCFVSFDPEIYVNENAVPIEPLPPEQRKRKPNAGATGEKPCKEQIREMLFFIPARPPYSVWLTVISAVGDALPEADAIEVLTEWSPEERPGEYADKLRHRLTKVRVGTLIYLANEHGWKEAETVARTKTESFGYFDAGRNCYWIRDLRGGWISLNETQFKRMLRRQGVSPKVINGKYVSLLDLRLIDVQQRADVHYAGALAGYSAGVYEMGERRILVTESPRIIAPKPGEWPTLDAVIKGLLHDSQVDQRPYLFGWLKVAYETLRAGERRPGQGLVIAGVHDCGKSLLQNLITVMLGGRSARPYQFMSGLTPFNSDLFEAEHLMIEDEQASIDIRARRNFGAQLKNITVVDWQRCHAKNRVAVSLAPFWRLSVTVNDEPENLMVLPPIDDSVEDKLIILRASRFPMPMPTATLAQRKAFWQRLVDELPAFLDFLLRWEIPSYLVGERFGISHFHHPDILQAINNLAPEYRLLRLIDDELFQSDESDPWEGSAEQLERRLCGETSTCRNEARKLFTFNTACGVYLARLHKRYPKRFKPIHTREGNRWTIHPQQSGENPSIPSQSDAL